MNEVIIMTEAKGPKHVVYFKRRRQGKTNYAKRLALIKSKKTKMLIRKSNKAIMIQFVDFAEIGDKTILTFHSKKLIKLFSWPAKRNVYTAYLTGLYAGKEAKKKNVDEFVLDIGLYAPTKGNVLFAALKGALDAGLKTNFDEEKIPLQKLNAPPENIKHLFEQTKAKILGK